MKLVVFASILAAASCSHQQGYQYQPPQARASTPTVRGNPAPASSFDHVQPGDGSYRFSYESADSSAHESGSPRASGPEGPAVTAEGGFSYRAPDGQQVSLTYVADENGFRPVGSHLPTPPPTPEAILRSLQLLGQKTGDAANHGSHNNNYDSVVIDARK